MGDVLAVAELREGAAGKPAREVTGLARSMADALGGEAHVIAVGGPGTVEAVSSLAGLGADRIFVAEGADPGPESPDVAAATVSARVTKGDYAAVLFPATARGKDVAPRVAGRLERGLATEITAWSVSDGAITVQRPMFAGKAIATLRFRESPALMTVRANVFSPEDREGAGEVVRIETVGRPRARVTAVEHSERDRLDVAEATIVVSGGRGMQDPENWRLLEDLVDALGEEATLGASRAVVDAGWRPHGEQVGQTGKTVSPNLYFAVGISGAIQHLAGMRTAKVIVAINRDADAPIFSVADYGVVGDLFEILPRLAEEIRSVRRDG